MLTTKEAAKYLEISEYYLRNMRHNLHNHEGPEYFVGKGASDRTNTCYYSYKDLDSWAKTHKWKSKA